MRFILNVPPRTTLTCSDFHKLGILKLNDRVKQLSLNHVHNFFYDKCPVYMKENFIKKSDVHSYCTRKSKCNFYVPVIKSATASTFYYNGVLTWNALPESIQCINSHFKFKKEVKKHFLNMYL